MKGQTTRTVLVLKVSKDTHHKNKLQKPTPWSDRKKISRRTLSTSTIRHIWSLKFKNPQKDIEHF